MIANYFRKLAHFSHQVYKQDMVYLSGVDSKRTRAQKIMRYVMGALACGLIVFILSQVPYDILREERHRMYGETVTTGMVTEVGADAASGYPFMVAFKYVDSDGIAREATAPLPREVWEQYRPGSPIEVLYIRARPDIVRVMGEIEPPFQLWLRRMLH